MTKPGAKRLAERAGDLFACPTGEHTERHPGQWGLTCCVARGVAHMLDFRVAARLEKVQTCRARVVYDSGISSASTVLRLSDSLAGVMFSRPSSGKDVALVGRGHPLSNRGMNRCKLMVRWNLVVCKHLVSPYSKAVNVFDDALTDRVAACNTREELLAVTRLPLEEHRGHVVKYAITALAKYLVEGRIRL